MVQAFGGGVEFTHRLARSSSLDGTCEKNMTEANGACG